ncbi:ArsR/SmtB family transcription factor [Flavisolibacter ginsenosidimutans]|uniref:Helix-turn-helix transcriptional regulator n=1 Tax=Flavisolibacter ginsenosidimutans TaxID=661481 RepID=A0A5B8ULN9_9BACT|nr:metalloregulator ArsR/SmtB family transcription factor [Flavisolibacter ginsenosidimutans]QEC57594.1 helix-turn-helix transcriptional regulator [Flavisolibacter ginsenosidimutans]
MPSHTVSNPLEIDALSLKNASLFFRAINHDFRQKIMQLIHKHGRMTVTEIYVKLRREQCVVSSHLAVLRDAKLVQAERAGKNIFYSVNYEQIKHLQSLAAELLKN